MKIKNLILLVFFSSVAFSMQAQFRLDVPGNARIRGRLDLATPDEESLYIGIRSGENHNSDQTERNVFVGAYTGIFNVSGESNTFIGDSSGRNNTSGNSNTFVGQISGMFNTSGIGNTFLGGSAGFRNTTASFNTFVGSSAGQQNQNGSGNTYLGSFTGFANEFGNENTMVGFRAGENNTTSSNTFIGYYSGNANQNGSGNTYIGREAARNAQNGYFNTMIGDRAGLQAGGNYNTLLGSNAGRSITGSGNTLLGSNAGTSLTSGGNNTLIGNNANVGSSNLTNAAAIGFAARVNCSNCMTLGAPGFNAVNVGIGTTNPRGGLHILKASTPPRGLSASENGLLLGIQNTAGYKWIQSYGGDLVFNPMGNNVGIGLTNAAYQLHLSQNSAAKPGSSFWFIASDARLKKNVKEFEDGLNVLMEMRPVAYQYNGKAGLPSDEQFIGVLAQDVQKVAPYMIEPYQHENENGKQTEYLGYDANALLYVLVNAVQEQQATIETTQEENDQLRGELATLRKEMEAIKAAFSRLNAENADTDKPTTVPTQAPPIGGELGQNIPNPFGGSTTIPYRIPQDVKQAILRITGLNGTVVKQIRLEERGQGQVEVSLDAAGTYFYSLILDGQLKTTKKMIRTNR